MSISTLATHYQCPLIFPCAQCTLLNSQGSQECGVRKNITGMGMRRIHVYGSFLDGKVMIDSRKKSIKTELVLEFNEFMGPRYSSFFF